jgi:hypothetical protein
MENFLSFLQYQGNEAALSELLLWCDHAVPSKSTHTRSTFTLELEALVSEATCDEMVRTQISRRHPPQKCTGIMTLPASFVSLQESQTRASTRLNKLIGDHTINMYFPSVNNGPDSEPDNDAEQA